jgi:hypothetical protein
MNLNEYRMNAIARIAKLRFTFMTIKYYFLSLLDSLDVEILQTLSKLIDNMRLHIHCLVCEKQGLFYYCDFMKFKISRSVINISIGAARERLVEVFCIPKNALYTLGRSKCDEYEEATVGNPTGVSRSCALVLSASTTLPLSLFFNPLYQIVNDLPLDKNSVHNLHLKFSSPQIYAIVHFAISNEDLGYHYTVNAKSKDIQLQAWEINGLKITVTIHRPDTVSVIIGCSLHPIALDVNSVIRLTDALSIVEGRLSCIVEGSYDRDPHLINGLNFMDDRHVNICCTIPSYSHWIVTSWHFGADSSIEYAGQMFSTTWKTAENILIRAYSKVMNEDTRIVRLEMQEYPKTTLADAIEQKINSNHRPGNNHLPIWSDFK